MNKQDRIKHRIYFLQDLKNLLEKHDAILEIEAESSHDIKFMYDLNGVDVDDRQRGNVLGSLGEYDDSDIQNLINQELYWEGNVK